MEAVNKIVKRYLRFYKPSTFEDVMNCLKLIENDYNHKRPHGSLKGLTPIEAYRQPEKILDHTADKRAAKTLRIAENQKANCQTCQK